MTYKCTVCGYREMVNPPKSHNICPCCGTEFGYDDSTFTVKELRNEWIEGGAHWFSRTNRAPANWNAMSQLARAGYLSNKQTSVTSSRTTSKRIFEDEPYQAAA